ncbi:MAG: hypothetical protein AAFO61_02480 [Pseudomonadota bacterium]
MKRFRILTALLGASLGLGTMAAHAACGGDVACTVSGENGGTYHYALPPSREGPLRAFVFFHGHNGSAKGVMRNKGLARALHEQGYVLVAPDGPDFTFRGRTVQGWAARKEPGEPRGGRNDIRFVERVLEDLATKVKLVPASTVLSGFSSGGSMAWYMGCYSQIPVAGVIAVAGGLRRPLPLEQRRKEDGSAIIKCPSPPRPMVHIHGWNDRQVPLEGRGIRAWHQGDVFEGLAVQRATNQCGSRPTAVESEGRLWCRSWTGCGTKADIHMCLHGGGHGMPNGWLDTGLSLLGLKKG